MKPVAWMVEAMDDRINPIAVKELRQAVQSRFVTGMLILLLLALLVAMTMMAGQGELSRMQGVSGFGGGREAFEVLFAVLLIGTMIFVPLYTGVRMAMERTHTNLDLLFTTALKPGAVIRGKLFAGMILTLLVFSICLPFMSFTYLLRGVDLPSIFIVLGMGFITIIAMTQFTLMLACVSMNRIVTAVLRLIALGIILWSSGMLIFFINELLASGIGSMLGSSDFWRDAAVFVGVIALIMGFSHIMSIALISPPLANRAPPIRLYLLLVWLIGAACVYSDANNWLDFEQASVVTLCAALLVTVSERDHIGARVKSAIPRNRVLRIAVFPFFSGAASGVIWTLAMIALMVLASSIHHEWHGKTFIKSLNMFGFFLYVYCYTFTAMLLRKYALARWVRAKDTWSIALALFAGGHFIPLIIFGFFSGFGLPDSDQVLYGNAFDLLENNDSEHFIFMGIWAVVLTILNIGWFVRQIREFKPLENTEK